MSRAKSGPVESVGPYEDEYRGFDARGEERGRGGLVLIIALGVLLIFAAVIWNTYRQGIRPTEGGLPVIADDTSKPYKRIPDEEGGFEVAGTDKSFYGLLDGSASNDAPVLSIGPTTPVKPAPELPPAPTSAKPVETVPRSPEPTEREVRVAVLTPSRKPEVSEEIRELAREAENTVKAAPPVKNDRFVSNGRFQIQLMALRSEKAAQDAWVTVKNKNPRLYAGARMDIQRADLGAKGVFYRLRVGQFSDRVAASQFCADVKTAGGDCIVVARTS